LSSAHRARTRQATKNDGLPHSEAALDLCEQAGGFARKLDWLDSAKPQALIQEHFNGGRDRTRTCDLLRVKQAL